MPIKANRFSPGVFPAVHLISLKMVMGNMFFRGRKPIKRAIVVLPAVWGLLMFVMLERWLPAQLRGAINAFSAPYNGPSFQGFLFLWGIRIFGLALFAWFQIGCLALGRVAVLFLLGVKGPGNLFSLPLGWLLMGLAMYAVSLDGIAFHVVLGAAAIAPGFLGWRPFIAEIRGSKNPVHGDFIWRSALVTGVVVLAIVTVAALAPEVEKDPLTYHYANPLHILILHRQVEWPFTIADDLPPLWEMVVLPLMALGGEGPTRWLNPFLAGFMAIVLYRLARKMMDRRWAMAAAVLLLTNPLVAVSATWAKNDLLATALSLAALCWILAGPPRRLTASCVIAGLLCGGAFITKYCAGSMAVSVLVAIVLVRRMNPARFASVSAGFLAAAAPVLSRNFLMTGNPVFPFASGVFPSPFFTEAARIHWATTLYVVTLQDPSAVSRWLSVNAAFGMDGRGEESFMRWMAFLPCVFLVPWRLDAAKASLGVLLVLVAGWAAGPPQVRYGMAVFPVGALVAAYCLSSLRIRRFPGVAGWIAAVAVVFQVVHICANGKICNAMRAGLGVEDVRGYRMRMMTSYETAVGAVNAMVPPRGRVFSHGEPRTAPIDPISCYGFFGSPVFPPFEMLKASRTPGEVWKKFRQQGWTHLLYNSQTAFFWRRTLGDDPWTERELELWTRFWRQHAVLEWESPCLEVEQGYFHLFRLVPEAREHSFAVIPGIEGWVGMMEGDARAGERETVIRRFETLRRVAGQYGVVDMLELIMFREELDKTRRDRLVIQASKRGYRSPVLFLSRARIAAEAGDRRAMNGWLKKARDFQPGLSGEYFDGVGREIRGAFKEASRNIVK